MPSVRFHFNTYKVPEPLVLSINLYLVVTGSQRLSEKGQRSPDVEVHVRVPLEKEVPLTLVLDEPKLLEEKPEFPELTEVCS